MAFYLLIHMSQKQVSIGFLLLKKYLLDLEIKFSLFQRGLLQLIMLNQQLLEIMLM